MTKDNDLTKDLFVNDAIDELLTNPFDEEEATSETVSHNFLDEELLAKKQLTNEKTIERLPEHRQKQAYDLAKQIDETQPAAIIAYGANAQKKLSEFSHQMLHQVKLTDVGEIGEILTDLMVQLENANVEELNQNQNFFQRLFNRSKASITETQMKYQNISHQIDKIAIKLEREKNELLNDNLILDKVYDKNKDYFEALNIYIAAGEVKMQELQEETIPKAIQKAKETNNQMDVQEVSDLNQFLDRLDKRVHDLRLTRQMTQQQAPQIRMIQNTNQALAEKIQVSVHTAIPLWENQVMIALALLRQQNAIDSQRKVTDTTNKLLEKNAEMLKQGATETAREVERGVIDIETLRKTQNLLVDTIQETLDIQEAGRKQRRLAERELVEMENQLRDNLLAISQKRKEEIMYGTDEAEEGNLKF